MKPNRGPDDPRVVRVHLGENTRIEAVDGRVEIEGGGVLVLLAVSAVDPSDTETDAMDRLVEAADLARDQVYAIFRPTPDHPK